MKMLLNKVQISSPELGDTGFPAPVQRVPSAVTSAAPYACCFRHSAAIFSASELNQQNRAKFRPIYYFKIFSSLMHFFYPVQSNFPLMKGLINI
jgi:hypothetical protein